MAHRVKCSVCGGTFDRDKEKFVQTSARRYAHYKCATGEDPPKTQEEIDKENLEEYIKKLFGLEYIVPRIRKQINNFVEEHNYTYSGIRGALIYFFEIKHNSIEKSNGGIGIVPFIYDEAKKYYESLQDIQEENKQVLVQHEEPRKEVVVIIKPPKRRIKKRKFFSFLDKEGE